MTTVLAITKYFQNNRNRWSVPDEISSWLQDNGIYYATVNIKRRINERIDYTGLEHKKEDLFEFKEIKTTKGVKYRLYRIKRK